MTSTAPAPPPADDRDWTFVITQGCAECGFQPFDPTQAAARLRVETLRWRTVLERPDVAQRPAPQVWSPLEYACHVRDMVRLLGVRVEAMRDAEHPTFADWDGDAKAVELAYWQADPAQTWTELQASAAYAADALDSVRASEFDRSGQRSDGVVFTIASLSQYIGHEMEHHLHDVDA